MPKGMMRIDVGFAAPGRRVKFQDHDLFIAVAVAIAFFAPIVAVMASDRRLGVLSVVAIGAFNWLLLANCMLVLLGKQRRGGSDRMLFRTVGVLGVCLVLSSLYAAVKDGRGYDVRDVALLAQFVAPYFWFTVAGERIARYSVLGRVNRALAAGIVVIAAWQVLSAGAVVFQQGQNAWITLARSGAANANVVGTIFVLGLALRLPQMEKSGVLWHGIALVITVAALVWTFSRSSYLAGAVVLGAYAIRSRRALALAAGVVIALGAASIIVPELTTAPLARIEFTTQGGSLDPSSRARITLWSASVRSFAANPILGLGFGRSVVEGGSGAGLAESRLLFSHNYFLTMAAQLGIVGVVLVLAIFWRVVQSAIVLRSRLIGQQSLLSTMAIVVVSLFGEPLLVPSCLVIFLLIISGSAWSPTHTRRIQCA